MNASSDPATRRWVDALRCLLAHAEDVGVADGEPLGLHVDAGSVCLTVAAARHLLAKLEAGENRT